MELADLENFIRANLVPSEQGWQCLVCGFLTKYKHRAWEHVEVNKRKKKKLYALNFFKVLEQEGQHLILLFSIS